MTRSVSDRYPTGHDRVARARLEDLEPDSRGGDAFEGEPAHVVGSRFLRAVGPLQRDARCGRWDQLAGQPARLPGIGDLDLDLDAGRLESEEARGVVRAHADQLVVERIGRQLGELDRKSVV